MNFFVKKYSFSNSQRLFWGAFLALFLIFFALFIHVWLFTNSVESFKTEMKITSLINTSKLIYDKYSNELPASLEETGKSKGKSWLSAYEEEGQSSGFDLFGEKKAQPGKEVKKTESTKFRDFSFVLGYIITNYGLPMDET